MEYEILNENSLKNVKAEFDERSLEWDVKQLKTAIESYKIHESTLGKEIAFKELSMNLYKEDSKILRPVFSYETNEKYCDMLRDMKMPELEAELNQKKGQMESTLYQLDLMAKKMDALLAEVIAEE